MDCWILGSQFDLGLWFFFHGGKIQIQCNILWQKKKIQNDYISDYIRYTYLIYIYIYHLQTTKPHQIHNQFQSRYYLDLTHLPIKPTCFLLALIDFKLFIPVHSPLIAFPFTNVFHSCRNVCAFLSLYIISVFTFLLLPLILIALFTWCLTPSTSLSCLVIHNHSRVQ